MKFIIGCFAFLGCLTLLVVAGCLGLAGVAIATLPDIPPYATKANVEGTYAKDLTMVRAYLEGKDEKLLSTLSSDIYAIYHDDDELLKRHTISSKSHFLSNHVGVGSLQIHDKTVACITYEVSKADDDYIIFIIDDGKLGKSGTGEPSVEPVNPEKAQ
jgi:hypothetical protein